MREPDMARLPEGACGVSAAPASGAGLRCEPLPALDQLEDLWAPLTEACGNPFLSWEWASTWWRHFGEGRAQRMLGCRDGDGNLVAIAPLYLESAGPLRTLRLVGHFPADELGLVCSPHLAVEVGRCLRDHLRGDRGWDLLLAERVPAAVGVREPMLGRRIRTEPMPELRIEASSWDDFLASRSANFRGQVRNYERRLLREHGLEFRLADDPQRLDEDMETLFSLHRRSWRSRGEEGAFSPELADFHREFAALALRRGWLRLWIASLDGEPAAAWYGFRLNGADWFYQGGRDPERERESIGFVLMAHTVRDAVENGIGCYRLLLGAEEYKKRFSNEVPEVETFVVTRTMRGRLALTAALARERLRAGRARS
jgi:CelD/BcsL family acetyltransferase involved in cellulose biosynthesis